MSFQAHFADIWRNYNEEVEAHNLTKRKLKEKSSLINDNAYEYAYRSKKLKELNIEKDKKIQELKIQLETKEKAIREVQQENAVIKSVLSFQHSVLETTLVELNTEKVNGERTRILMEEKEKTIDGLKKDLIRVENVSMHLQKELDQKTDELEKEYSGKLEKEMAALQLATKEKIKMEESVKDEQIRKLNEELDQMKSVVKDVLENLMEAKKGIQSLKDFDRKEIESKKRISAEQQGKIEKLKKELDEFKKDAEHYEKELEKATQDMKTLKKDNSETLQKKNHEIWELYVELGKLYMEKQPENDLEKELQNQKEMEKMKMCGVCGEEQCHH